MTENPPTRLILCVDGTWCDPDGPWGDKSKRNITNVYRVFASIQRGAQCFTDGKRYDQVVKYFPGIAARDEILLLTRIREGAFGGECFRQIKEVYRECCLLNGKDDEVWLYGFSRGAYVVRAVAGLLHYIRALVSAKGPDKTFEQDFEKALKIYRKMQRSDKLGTGQIHSMLAANTNPAPTIKFIGLFDTVKAVKDENLYEITFNNSIQHLRHALALNEDRASFLPEYLYPNLTQERPLQKRSILQSWFIGAHSDIGGSSEKDGLSLYPLQWMLIESRDAGLCLKFFGSIGGRASIENPLELTGLENSAQDPWSCQTSNGVLLKMVDIRQIHSNQSTKNYEICVNKAKGSFWGRKNRSPFDEHGDLNGFCSFVINSEAPHGTVIHPSVYLLLDKYIGLSLNMKAFPFHPHLERWRQSTLGQKDNSILGSMGFWNDGRTAEPDPGAIRILVCGNAGVGKSSLINSIFGVHDDESHGPTQVSHRKSGKHDVTQEITWNDRDDLVIHDSGGFEAAGEEEFKVIEEFLKQKSVETELEKRLHAIWYCLETNDSRPTQKSTSKLFPIISQYARDIPVIVIATKKDEFEGIKEKEARKRMQKEGQPVTLEAMEQEAQNQLRLRVQQIEKEILSLDGGRFDACVAISTDDDQSIENLSKKTEETFSHDRIRLLYIRAQVARIDSKIDLAKAETMRIYKSVLSSSSSLAAAPMIITTNRMSAATDLCRALITCFGMPKVSADTAFSIYRQTMPDDIGNGLAVAFAEAVAAAGILGTVFTGGIVPAFLVSQLVNVPLVVPANARLLLMLASDLILIFARSFREASAKCVTQPLAGDLQRATSAYRAHCKEVHRRVSELIRKRDVVKAFQLGVVEKGFGEIIGEFKKPVMETMQAPTRGARFMSDKGDDIISTDMADITDALNYAHEMKEQKTVTKDAELPPDYAAISIQRGV